MTTLIAMAHRHLSMPTMKAVLDLVGQRPGWTFRIETGDALLCRARSTAISEWLRTSTDDVVVMTDDDFYFTPDGIEQLAAWARDHRCLAAGVTPLRSGEYTAIVPFSPSSEEPWKDPSRAPERVKWAGGLVAYHRSVFEALTHTLPLLHKHDRIPAFWPFFMPAVTTAHGQDIYLSEDYACHERARKLGFDLWVVPGCQVSHLAEVPVTTTTMGLVQQVFNAPTVDLIPV